MGYILMPPLSGKGSPSTHPASCRKRRKLNPDGELGPCCIDMPGAGGVKFGQTGTSVSSSFSVLTTMRKQARRLCGTTGTKETPASGSLAESSSHMEPFAGNNCASRSHPGAQQLSCRPPMHATSGAFGRLGSEAAAEGLVEPFACAKQNTTSSQPGMKEAFNVSASLTPPCLPLVSATAPVEAPCSSPGSLASSSSSNCSITGSKGCSRCLPVSKLRAQLHPKPPPSLVKGCRRKVDHLHFSAGIPTPAALCHPPAPISCKARSSSQKQNCLAGQSYASQALGSNLSATVTTAPPAIRGAASKPATRRNLASTKPGAAGASLHCTPHPETLAAAAAAGAVEGAAAGAVAPLPAAAAVAVADEGSEVTVTPVEVTGCDLDVAEDDYDDADDEEELQEVPGSTTQPTAAAAAAAGGGGRGRVNGAPHFSAAAAAAAGQPRQGKEQQQHEGQEQQQQLGVYQEERKVQQQVETCGEEQQAASAKAAQLLYLQWQQGEESWQRDKEVKQQQQQWEELTTGPLQQQQQREGLSQQQQRQGEGPLHGPPPLQRQQQQHWQVLNQLEGKQLRGPLALPRPTEHRQQGQGTQGVLQRLLAMQQHPSQQQQPSQQQSQQVGNGVGYGVPWQGVVKVEGRAGEAWLQGLACLNAQVWNERTMSCKESDSVYMEMLQARKQQLLQQSKQMGPLLVQQQQQQQQQPGWSWQTAQEQQQHQQGAQQQQQQGAQQQEEVAKQHMQSVPLQQPPLQSGLGSARHSHKQQGVERPLAPPAQGLHVQRKSRVCLPKEAEAALVSLIVRIRRCLSEMPASLTAEEEQMVHSAIHKHNKAVLALQTVKTLQQQSARSSSRGTGAEGQVLRCGGGGRLEGEQREVGGMADRGDQGWEIQPAAAEEVRGASAAMLAVMMRGHSALEAAAGAGGVGMQGGAGGGAWATRADGWQQVAVEGAAAGAGGVSGAGLGAVLSNGGRQAIGEGLWLANGSGLGHEQQHQHQEQQQEQRERKLCLQKLQQQPQQQNLVLQRLQQQQQQQKQEQHSFLTSQWHFNGHAVDRLQRAGSASGMYGSGSLSQQQEHLQPAAAAAAPVAGAGQKRSLQLCGSGDFTPDEGEVGVKRACFGIRAEEKERLYVQTAAVGVAVMAGGRTPGLGHVGIAVEHGAAAGAGLQQQQQQQPQQQPHQHQQQQHQQQQQRYNIGRQQQQDHQQPFSQQHLQSESYLEDGVRVRPQQFSQQLLNQISRLSPEHRQRLLAAVLKKRDHLIMQQQGGQQQQQEEGEQVGVLLQQQQEDVGQLHVSLQQQKRGHTKQNQQERVVHTAAAEGAGLLGRAAAVEAAVDLGPGGLAAAAGELPVSTDSSKKSSVTWQGGVGPVGGVGVKAHKVKQQQWKHIGRQQQKGCGQAPSVPASDEVKLREGAALMAKQHLGVEPGEGAGGGAAAGEGALALDSRAAACRTCEQYSSAEGQEGALVGLAAPVLKRKGAVAAAGAARKKGFRGGGRAGATVAARGADLEPLQQQQQKGVLLDGGEAQGGVIAGRAGGRGRGRGRGRGGRGGRSSRSRGRGGKGISVADKFGADPFTSLPSIHQAHKVALSRLGRFVVRRSGIAQMGLYTTEDIPRGEMLVEYAGEVVRQSVADLREKKYQQAGLGNYLFTINREYVVDATMCGNISRFINHSCR